MSLEYILILELASVIVIITVIALIIWRDKKNEILALKDINDELLVQVASLQSHIEALNGQLVQVQGETILIEAEMEDALTDDEVAFESGWAEMEQLAESQKSHVLKLSEELQNQTLDLKTMESELALLKKSLEKSERRIRVQKKELDTSKNNLKEAKDKLKHVSQKVLSMGGLEISERRLKKDKDRLQGKIDDLKKKFEDQKIISKKLEDELRVSYRASEVQEMKDELRSIEEKLKRVSTEKAFIETHFQALVEQGDPDDLRKELERAHREIQLLEQTVLEMDKLV